MRLVISISIIVPLVIIIFAVIEDPERLLLAIPLLTLPALMGVAMGSIALIAKLTHWTPTPQERYRAKKLKKRWNERKL